MRGLVFQTRVDHQRTTTGLILRDDDFAALGGENARGCFVDMLKEDLLNTAGEHADTAAHGMRPLRCLRTVRSLVWTSANSSM